MAGRLRAIVVALSATAALVTPESVSVTPAYAHHDQTTRVSVGSCSEVCANGAEGNGDSVEPAASADGRFIAFSSAASNLVAGDSNGVKDVFVKDRVTGETTRVSVSSDGVQGDGDSIEPDISSDGRFVAFTSLASNLVPRDTNSAFDVFVHDRSTGQTSRASVTSGGNEGGLLASSDQPAISGDGRFAAFRSSAQLVTGDTNGAYDIYVRDLWNGETSRVSVSTTGVQSNGASYTPSLSSDGRYVAFASAGDNLVFGDLNVATDVFVHDRQTNQTTRVSVDSNGVEARPPPLSASFAPSISGDGRFVSFTSGAANLVVGDLNSRSDVFVHDRLAAQTTRVSVSSSGVEGNDHSWASAMSADGRVVSFWSDADNLAVDMNTKRDVFVHDRQTGQTTLESVASDGMFANGDSLDPAISTDGRYVAFSSSASNLVSDDRNGRSDIFVRDRGETDPPAITSFAADSTAFSPNGDGIKDTTTFSAQLSDDSPPIEWALEVKNASGLVVRAFSGLIASSSAQLSQQWDGRGTDALTVADGEYTAQLMTTDHWGNVGQSMTSVVVDTAAPAVVASWPPVSANAVELIGVSATWEDALSPISAMSGKLWLDDVPLVATNSGSTFSAQVSAVASGIHTLRAEATDEAGNTGSESFEFTLVTIDAAPAAATLRSKTVFVNPDGDLPPPTQVTFRNPEVDVEGFSERFNANTQTGYGQVHRLLDLTTVEVKFVSNVGHLVHTTEVTVPPKVVPHDIAMLARSADELTADIEGETVTLPDIVVDVPVGFGTQGSRATLISKMAPLGPSWTVGTLLADEPFEPGPLPVTVGTSAGVVVENMDAGGSVSSIPTKSKAWVVIDGGTFTVPLWDTVFPSEGHFTFAGIPTVTCSGGGTGCVSNAGQPTYQNQGHVSLARESGFALYANHWVFRDSGGPPYLAWNQVSAVTGESRCWNGMKLVPKLQSFSTGVRQTATSVDGQSLWNLVTDADGNWTSYTSTSGVSTTTLGWGSGHTLSNSNENPYGFGVSEGAALDAEVVADAGGPLGGSLTWSNDNGVTGTQEPMSLGAAFVRRDPNATTIRLDSDEEVNLSVERAPCP